MNNVQVQLLDVFHQMLGDLSSVPISHVIIWPLVLAYYPLPFTTVDNMTKNGRGLLITVMVQSVRGQRSAANPADLLSTARWRNASSFAQNDPIRLQLCQNVPIRLQHC